MAAIKTNGLGKRFGELRAVDRLSLEIGQGEIFGLVGPDGAGKSTTMRMLAAILDPTEGEAFVMGKHIVKDAETIKTEIGYMSQRFGLYPDLTVIENVNFYADIYGVARAGREDKIERLLSFSNLAPFKRRLAGNLSGGMKQKLGLACALIHTPKVLLLDEPTNGVDPVSRRDFWRILYQLLQEGVTIFVSTAYLDEAERCARVGLMHKGRLLAVDTPDRVKRMMRGSLIEVRSSNAREAVEVLRDLLPSQSVSLFGDRIHVLSISPHDTIQAVKARLGESGLDVEDAQVVEPSLEDVFVSVLSSTESQHEQRP
ncbi:MAG: ABC transporter ATP-binding protein [Acidobacteriota bacterium]